MHLGVKVYGRNSSTYQCSRILDIFGLGYPGFIKVMHVYVFDVVTSLDDSDAFGFTYLVPRTLNWRKYLLYELEEFSKCSSDITRVIHLYYGNRKYN